MLINSDFKKDAVLLCEYQEWHPSPIHGVDRIMLDRLGAETGRATSIVRYQPNSKFAEHIHTGGEEFLVLEGEFKDENGSYPVGTYVRNPIGTKHAPWADDAGATIFVKLHQFHETDREQLQKTVFSETQILKTPDRYQNKPIHKHDNESVSIRFLPPNYQLNVSDLKGGVELFVLAGSISTQLGFGTRRSWFRLIEKEQVAITAGESGAIFYLKCGHLDPVIGK